MRVTQRQLRTIIRESIREQQHLDEANIIKGLMDKIATVSKTLDDIVQAPAKAVNAAIDKAVGPHMEKLYQWLEDNADNVPGYMPQEEWDKKIVPQFDEMVKKAEEARERWREEHPGEDPPWEKTFLGIQATDWLVGTPLAGHFSDYIDPGHKAVYGETIVGRRQLRRLIKEEMELALLPIGLELEVGGKLVSAEVVSCPQSRNQGLMHRMQLSPDCGMLFAYPDSAPRSFWMENTYIPLSIAFINEAGTILNIEDMMPFDRKSVRSDGDAVYALEMAQGWFNKNQIGRGRKVMGLPGHSVM